MAVINLDKISKTYELGKIKVKALSDINLKVEAGEMVAIVGPSGSGKSTLMNIIGLVDRPTEGTLAIDQQKVDLNESDSRLAKLRSEKIGFVFQTFNLLPRISAWENVLLPTIYNKQSQDGHRKRSLEILGQVGLGKRVNHKPTELSGGEKQRVAIARALINNPDIILADEQTGNLDSASGRDILNILKDLNKNGKTVMIITHDEKIAKACGRQIYLLDGKIT